MPNALMIVDPQWDFIGGSLPVPQATPCMDALARYIEDNDALYDLKIVTIDHHPYDHCSFRDNGGQWPRHCVQHTAGAAIYDGVFQALHRTSGQVAVLSKGERKEMEEYSIFASGFYKFNELIQKYGIDKIDICGIAGDICVLNTLKDGIGIYGKEMFSVLPKFSPSLDNGIALAKFWG